MKQKLLSTLAFVAILVGCSHPKPEPTGAKISPYLFGQNLWLTDGAEGRPGYIEESLWPKVKASGVKIIRVGGNGYDVALPGIDTLTNWVKGIKAIGAEPLFQVSKIESAEKAAALVKYFNVDNNYKIKYWSIGNEPHIIAHWPIDSVSKYIKSHATAMKEIDPSIQIFIPDEAAYDKELYEALLLDDSKSVAGRDKNGNWYIDGVNFHNYPNSKDYTRSDVIFYSVSKMRGMILELKAVLDKANAKYARYGDNKLSWGLTEFNITYNNPDDHSIEGIAVPSFINGQFWVDVFALGMEYNAFCITPWCIQESDRASSYFGYVGAPPDFKPHSTYYHMQMMAENMSGNFIKFTSSNPYVKVFGSENEESTTILIMNQHNMSSFNIDLNQINKDADAETDIRITSNSNIRAEYSGTIFSNSTELLVFNKEGFIQKHLVYNLELASKNQQPSVIQ